MIDDDTYLVKHNLAQILKKYDHRKKLYFGHPNMFIGCDGKSKLLLLKGVTEFGQGPSFAHGGSGIVLSNGAMKVLLENLDKCIIKYKSCWAGDVRTALCLRDNGILIQNIPGFNKEPPLSLGGVHPCEKPLTFHHLLVKQIQTIWESEYEWLSLNKKTRTFSEIYTSLAEKLNITDFIADTDMPGYDIKHTDTPNAITCQELCRKTSKCVSFSYITGICWLKDAAVSGEMRVGAVSGFLRDKFVCRKSLLPFYK
jgi:hypothetical protein